MSEQKPKSRKSGTLLWLLVLVAVVLVWWFFRSAPDNGRTAEQRALDRASAPYDRDEILVDLVDDASAADVRAIERELGIDLVLVSNESEDEQFYRAKVDPARQADILAALEGRQGVELAEPDATYFLTPGQGYQVAAELDPEWEGFPNDPQYKHQWHLDQVHMREAWKLADGNGVVVAVLDTGVAYEKHSNFHMVEDLAGVEFVKPYDFVGNNKHANDDHGHGTHVAGTIAQATHNGIGVAGVARNVKIMPLKVLSGSGSGSVGGIADAIRYAADNGAQVINMSLGGPFPSRALKKAVAYAHNKGVTVICAAGNDGRSKVGYPAAFPGSVAISATQYDETVTFYSNHGKNLDIAAPGGNTRVDQNNDGMPDGVLQNTIVVRDPTKSGYFGFMGTSMASPHAAGVAALVVGEGVTDPKAVEQILKDTARAPSKGKLDKAKYGAGIIDAEAAILKARSQTGGWQFMLGLLMAGALAVSMRRRGTLGIKLGGGYWVGMMVGASGLFFLPLVAGSLSSVPIIETLTRGLPSWDLGLLGAAGHGNALFFSALLPVGLVSLVYGVPKLRGLAAGLSVGVAAHLVFHAAAGITDVQWIPGSFFDPMWLAMNAAVALGVAKLAMRR
ncbi:MAG: S8 family peptidase [Deltaproteobacteria bacterium]|nr:S8 family peptidase [Deltaproteobacteria bacterium]